MAFSHRRSSPTSPTAREQLFTIGDMARQFGVTLRTLRFYEDKGLLTPHREGTSRLYRESDKAKIAMILKGKELGFTLGEIRESLAASGKNSNTSLFLNPEQIQSQIEHLTRQRKDIESAIDQLRSAHAAMTTSHSMHA